MQKRFFIWKDKNCKGVNPEWIEVKYPEFKKIMIANKSVPKDDKRWFYRLPPVAESDDYIVMECTFEKYRESQNDKDKRMYRSKLRDDFYDSYSTVSFDFVYTDDSGEEYTLHDVVADGSVDIEESTLNNMDLFSLKKAIFYLSSSDKSFIDYWIESIGNGMTEMDISRSLGLTRKAYRYRFFKICNALKNFL